MAKEPQKPEDVRLQRDEFPPVLYMDQMDEAGRSVLLDLYNGLFGKVQRSPSKEDALNLEEFAKLMILTMAYRHNYVNVAVFRDMVATAKGDEPMTVEQVHAIKKACDDACRLLRNPAGYTSSDDLLPNLEKGKQEGPLTDSRYQG